MSFETIYCLFSVQH